MSTLRSYAIVILLSLLGVFVLKPEEAISYIDYLQVVPSHPNQSDSVVLWVFGFFYDGCWGIEGYEFSPAGQAFRLDVHCVDIWNPEIFCLAVIIEYEHAEPVGTLAPGTYTFEVAEHHQSLRDPFPDSAQIIFSVEPLVDGEEKAGYKVARWDASSFPGGIYFCRLKAGDFEQTRRMILLK